MRPLPGRSPAPSEVVVLMNPHADEATAATLQEL
jgi:hypothetical protein